MHSNFADGVKFMKYNAVKEPGYTYDSLGNLKRLIMFGFQKIFFVENIVNYDGIYVLPTVQSDLHDG